MSKSNKSDDYKYGTLDYYHCRVVELEKARDEYHAQSNYYQTELAKAHEVLGRVIHQLSERWDSVHLTSYFPTDNLHGKRHGGNPTGKEINNGKEN